MKKHNEESNEKNTENSDTEEKETSDKKKSLFEVAKEIEEREKREEEEKYHQRQIEMAKREEKQREEYAKRLRQEKIELMRMKQGVEEESELIKPEEVVEKHYTVWQKIGNFFYHSKWWLWFAVFLVAIFSYLIYDAVSQKDPDLVVLMLSADQQISEHLGDIETLMEEYIYDYNGDGEKYVSVYNIPITKDMDIYDDLDLSYKVKLTAEFQMGDNLIVIGDKGSISAIKPKETLLNLEKYYPDNKLVDDYGFYLKDTNFAKAINSDEKMEEDLYIGIRAVTKNVPYTEEMQEHFDVAFPVLEKFINDFSVK